MSNIAASFSNHADVSSITIDVTGGHATSMPASWIIRVTYGSPYTLSFDIAQSTSWLDCTSHSISQVAQTASLIAPSQAWYHIGYSYAIDGAESASHLAYPTECAFAYAAIDSSDVVLSHITLTPTSNDQITVDVAATSTEDAPATWYVRVYYSADPSSSVDLRIAQTTTLLDCSDFAITLLASSSPPAETVWMHEAFSFALDGVTSVAHDTYPTYCALEALAFENSDGTGSVAAITTVTLSSDATQITVDGLQREDADLPGTWYLRVRYQAFTSTYAQMTMTMTTRACTEVAIDVTSSTNWSSASDSTEYSISINNHETDTFLLTKVL